MAVSKETWKKLDRMPDWVKDLVKSLEAYGKKYRDLYFEDEFFEDSPFRIWDSAGTDKRLHPDTRLRVYLVEPDEKNSIGVYITIYLNDGGLRIEGSDTLLLEPRAANAFMVHVNDWQERMRERQERRAEANRRAKRRKDE